MFSLFDLHEICDNDVKLHQFLQKYGLESCNRVTNPVVCPKCSQEIPNDLHQHRGKAHWRCSNMECRHRVPYSSNSLLEGCHLPLKTLLFLFYFWAHDIGANKISAMLGLSTATLASWSDRLRICVANGEAAHWQPLGGRDIEVECDETEIGRRQKGIYGHKTVVKGDIWGAVERESGRIILELYDKCKQGEDIERRFGPPRADELTELCEDHIKAGTLLYTDGARAYEQISANLGYSHAYVDHSKGEYSKKKMIKRKLRSVHTNTIDGWWSRLKTWWNARGGIQEDHHHTNLKEFQWRTNLGDKDPFICLLEFNK